MKTKKKVNVLLIIAYGYIVLPFIILMLGWTKFYIAIPVVAAIAFCFWKICCEMPSLWLPKLDRENMIKILFIIVVIAIWVYYSGIGKFVFQNTDHVVRNGVFNILVEYKWPIINYDIVEEFNRSGRTDITATSLIYYIGYWLPSALVGKVLGIRAGYYAQAVWALLGLVLIYYLICVIFKKITIWPLFIFIFFSGLDSVGAFLTTLDMEALEVPWHIEWWCTPYQYSSMTTQLFWTFNQSVPAWLCTMLAYMQKNNRNLVFILACSMLSSTFPFIGLLALVVFFCFTRRYERGQDMKSAGRAAKIKEYLKSLIKDTCTVQNVLGGGLIGIITFLYLSTNLSGSRIMGENTRGPDFENSLAKLVIFLILEVGVYFILLYKYNKNNHLLYFIVLCLCVIPPIKVGYSNDFCMRASIPALFILMVLVIEAVYRSWEQRDYKIFAGLLVVILLGSVTPVYELKRTFTETFTRIREDRIVYIEDIEAAKILNSPNFSGDIEDSLFFKYLVR